MNRRGFIGTLGALLALPFAKLRAKYKPKKIWRITKYDPCTKTITVEQFALRSCNDDKAVRKAGFPVIIFDNDGLSIGASGAGPETTL